MVSLNIPGQTPWSSMDFHPENVPCLSGCDMMQGPKGGEL